MGSAGGRSDCDWRILFDICRQFWFRYLGARAGRKDTVYWAHGIADGDGSGLDAGRVLGEEPEAADPWEMGGEEGGRLEAILKIAVALWDWVGGDLYTCFCAGVQGRWVWRVGCRLVIKQLLVEPCGHVNMRKELWSTLSRRRLSKRRGLQPYRVFMRRDAGG